MSMPLKGYPGMSMPLNGYQVMTRPLKREPECVSENTKTAAAYVWPLADFIHLYKALSPVIHEVITKPHTTLYDVLKLMRYFNLFIYKQRGNE